MALDMTRAAEVLAEWVPESLLEGWQGVALCAAVSTVVLLVSRRVLLAAARRLISRNAWSALAIERGERQLTACALLLIVEVIFTAAPDDLRHMEMARHFTGLALIMAVTWLLMRLVTASDEYIVRKHPIETSDARARSVVTQARLLTRIVNFVIALIGVSAVMMTFPSVRQFGTSLLASAGVSALVVGLAAKSVLGNLLAGLQIALTQPIRIDDVLIVEGEWGRVEEITSTYVVINIWDQRRLVVPLQYFIEKPFQNWTRNSSELIGTVMLWVDYHMPIELIRSEAQRICEQAPEWDKRLVKVQVTDTTETSQQVRILVTARDAGSTFDLRCTVREGLISYIQRECPQHFPQRRIAVGALSPAEAVTGDTPEGTPPLADDSDPAQLRPQGPGLPPGAVAG